MNYLMNFDGLERKYPFTHTHTIEKYYLVMLICVINKLRIFVSTNEIIHNTLILYYDLIKNI